MNKNMNANMNNINNSVNDQNNMDLGSRFNKIVDEEYKNKVSKLYKKKSFFSCF